MRLLVLTNTPVNLTLPTARVPFVRGRNCVATNFTAGNLIVEGSDDGTTYTTLVTVPLSGQAFITALPAFIRVSTAATVYLTAGV